MMSAAQAAQQNPQQQPMQYPYYPQVPYGGAAAPMPQQQQQFYSYPPQPAPVAPVVAPQNLTKKALFELVGTALKNPQCPHPKPDLYNLLRLVSAEDAQLFEMFNGLREFLDDQQLLESLVEGMKQH